MTHAKAKIKGTIATAGVPEVRECQAFGVLNDEQIGQPSDIVSVTFGG